MKISISLRWCISTAAYFLILSFLMPKEQNTESESTAMPFFARSSLIRMKFNVQGGTYEKSFSSLAFFCSTMDDGDKVVHFVKINKNFLHLIYIYLYHEGTNLTVCAYNKQWFTIVFFLATLWWSCVCVLKQTAKMCQKCLN